MSLVHAFKLRDRSPGVPKALIQASPSAGVELSLTCPGGKIWHVLGVNATLTTSAVAGTRRPALILDDGNTTALRLQATTTTVVSHVTPYSWVNAFPDSAGADNIGATEPLPDWLTMASGWRLRSVTSALDPGDTWTAITFFVVEYFDGVIYDEVFALDEETAMALAVLDQRGL